MDTQKRALYQYDTDAAREYGIRPVNFRAIYEKHEFTEFTETANCGVRRKF